MTGPATGEPASGAFASAGLVALAVEAFGREDPELLPAGLRAVDPMRAARIDPGEKRAILDHAFRRGGAGPLLRVGRILPDFATSPTIAVLSASADPAILAGKWMRFERYHHSSNRTAIETRDDGYDCRRSAKGEPPSAAETLLIAGILAGLAAMAGAADIRVGIAGRGVAVEDDSLPGWPEDRETERFALRWRCFEPRRRDDAGAAKTGGSHASAVRRLQALLGSDPARSWRLVEAARALGLSTRTLQRELTAAGRSFTSVMRGVRFEEAGRLLGGTDSPLSEIGYCCGYADQAHFQRDFLRVANMTPRAFRRAVRP